MRELLLIAAGTLLGSCLGVTMMCLFQINKDCRVKRKEDTDYEKEKHSEGYDFNHYECCWIWNSGTDDLARRDGNDHRGLRIFREYSIVGGNAYRRIIYHGAFVHSDNDGVRKIFQVVYSGCRIFSTKTVSITVRMLSVKI